MKSLPLILLFAVSNLLSYGQIDFEKGYYIDDAGGRVECLIRNVDWDYNPTSFTIKKTNGESAQLTIEHAREFGIYGGSRYVRATVDVDRSSDKMDKLSSIRAPEFKTERVYLKTLVEGRATLYLFSDGIIRFYYQTDTATIQPLVYKRYRSSDLVLENQTFREQLYRLFSCGTPGREDVDRANYAQRDLTKLFIQYNKCLGSVITDHTPEKKSRDFFNLWIRPRVTLSSLSASRSNYQDFDFENQVGFSAGIEAEFILPFNRNKWAIMIEPTYQSYDASIPSEPIKVDYQALELPLGLRHYFYVNDNSKISLSFAFQVTLPFQSEVIHYSNVEWEIKNTANMAFEAGYVFKNRFCTAYRLQTNKELLGGYAIWSSNYSTMAFVVGYSLF